MRRYSTRSLALISRGQVTLIGLVLGIVSLGCDGPVEPSKPAFITTIEPLAMILRELAGDRGEVVALIPPGASPHTYVVRPSEARAAQDSRAFFFVDPNLDGWAAALSVGDAIAVFEMLPELARIDATEHSGSRHTKTQYNPHFWTDPLAVRELIPELAEALLATDPEGEEVFTESSARFVAQLEQVHREIETLLQPLKGVSVVVFHPSWAYFLQRYGIETAAVLEPSPGREPTPKYLKGVIDAARAAGARVVLTEPQLPRPPAEVVAEAASLALLELDPMGGPDEIRYCDWLMDSARRLAKALE